APARDASPGGQATPWVPSDEGALGRDSASSIAAVCDGGVYEAGACIKLSDGALATDISLFSDAATDASVDAQGFLPECMSDEDCPVTGNPCLSPRCDAGTCTITPAAEGTACGEGATPCSAQDRCDGTG